MNCSCRRVEDRCRRHYESQQGFIPADVQAPHATEARPRSAAPASWPHALLGTYLLLLAGSFIAGRWRDAKKSDSAAP
jgi:hypothetical protein